MGTCLSCCKANLSTDSQGNSEKFTEICPNADVVIQASDMNYEPVQLESNNTEIFAPVNSNGDSCCNKSSTEKKMFYQRIPPILSSTSGDNKRSSHQSREYSESKISALFEQYKDPVENTMLSEGIERFCIDLNVKPEEFRTLLLAWKFNAQQMCCFTREEFIEGCRNLKVDSIQGIQAKFPEMMKEMQEPEKFKDFYRFTFKFGLELGQRVLMSEMAVQLWKLVFFYNEPPILNRWLAFLEKHPNVRSISRDTWNMFLNFSETVGDDLSSYDDTEAWPSLFDDFVEYENDQTNQNIVPNKEICVLDI